MVRTCQCLGDEWVKEPDSNTAGQTQSKSFRRSLCASREAPIRYCVEHDSDANQRNSPEQEHGMPCRRNDVVDYGSDDQGQAGSYRERYGHPGHRYRGHEQQVSEVEDDTTEESLQQTAGTCSFQIAKKAVRRRAVS